MSYSLEEQETTINLYPKQMSDKAEIFTCIPSMITRLRKLAKDHPSDVCIRDKDGCLLCTVPFDWIKIGPKRRVAQTEEQKRANIARLKAYREAKQNDAT